MDDGFEKLMKVNIQGRVFVTCQSRGVSDPAIISYYVEILEQAIGALLHENSTPGEFKQILDDQVKWLEGELDQTGNFPQPSPAVTETEATETEAAALTPKEEKSTGGHLPEAMAMPERLKAQRATIEQLLDNDCITLKLVTPNESKKYKLGLLGKEPEQAEEEVVAALRNVLYEQVRKFIRKHNGGPWATATQQHEVRMEITKTRSLRALVTLSRELLREREEWLEKSKGSITGRFFKGRVEMNK